MVSRFKVFLSVVLFFFFASTVFAGDYAVDKGSALVSGTFSFANASGDLYEEDGNSATTISLNPSVLYFVIPNFAVGGNFLLAHTSQGDASMSALAIGPKVAYFIGGPNSKVYPYFGAGFAYVRQSVSLGGGDDFTISGTKISLGAGAAVMVKPHWALVFEGAYNLDNMKPENEESVSGNIFAVSVGIAGFIF